MKPPLVNAALASLSELARELAAAQQGPIDPVMRSELARIAAATETAHGRVGESHQAATESITAKRKLVKDLAAANKAAIRAKRAPAQKVNAPSDKPAVAPIDPALGRRLAAELLARQASRHGQASGTRHGSVLDDWEWAPPAAQ